MNTRATLTRSVYSVMEGEKTNAFRAFIDSSLRRFIANDWGTSRDKALNDSDPMSAMGVYTSDMWGDNNTIWIKSDDYRGSGQEINGEKLERVITIMFPSDY